nr:MAG TPA: hypothetical protein [Caudoviricetes sp.]DAX22585.1 MAG TPA: hypothetical protein [Caudoviricetes sp.]
MLLRVSFIGGGAYVNKCISPPRVFLEDLPNARNCCNY